MSKKLLASLALVGLVAIGALITGRECDEDECVTVDRSEKYITDILIGKYGLDPDTARSIAEDLLSGSYERAKSAVRKLKDLGALNDVLDAISRAQKK